MSMQFSSSILYVAHSWTRFNLEAQAQHALTTTISVLSMLNLYDLQFCHLQ
jgi:hypothetical protein